MNTYIIRGALKANTPIAYSQPGLDAPTGFPAPLPRFKRVNDEGQHQNHLYIPGTSLSGVLRRACSDIMIDRAKEIKGTSTPLSLDELRLAWVGGVGESGTEDQGQLARALLKLPHWQKVNPILEIFGAGAAGDLNFVASKIIMENAVSKTPLEPTVLGRGVRTRDFTRSPERLALLDDEQYGIYSDSLDSAKAKSAVKDQIKKLKVNLKKAGITSEEKADLQKQIDALTKEEKEITLITDLLPLSGFEAIPEGATFSHRMILRQASDVALGLLLAGLDRFAKDGAYVGGHRKHGCGQISGEYEVVVVKQGKEEVLGTVGFEGFAGLQATSGMAPFQAAAQSILEAGEFDLSLPTR